MRYRYIFDKKNINKLLFVSRHNKNNERLDNEYSTIGKDIKVYGFYHAFCMLDGWEKLVTEQFTHLRNSGLYDRMDTIYCSFIGEKNRTSDFLTIGGGNVK